MMAHHESNHRRHRLDDPLDRDAYPHIVMDMLIARPAVRARHVNAAHLINKQLLYIDEATDTVRPIHDLVRQFYLAQGHLKAGLRLDTTVIDVLENETVTGDVKGRMAEAYIISCLEAATHTFTLHAQLVGANRTLGPTLPIFRAAAAKVHPFDSVGVPAQAPWQSHLLLVPTSSSYPGVDLFLWDADRRALAALQITVGQAHDMTFSRSLEQRWKTVSGADTVHFVWAAPALPTGGPSAGHYFVSFEELRSLCALLSRYRAYSKPPAL